MGSKDGSTTSLSFPEGKIRPTTHRKLQEMKAPFSLSRDGRCIIGGERLLKG